MRCRPISIYEENVKPISDSRGPPVSSFYRAFHSRSDRLRYLRCLHNKRWTLGELVSLPFSSYPARVSLSLSPFFSSGLVLFPRRGMAVANATAKATAHMSASRWSLAIGDLGYPEYKGENGVEREGVENGRSTLRQRISSGDLLRPDSCRYRLPLIHLYDIFCATWLA